MAKNEANYKATIEKCNKQLSAIERIKIKDTADAISINEVMEEKGSLVFTPDVSAVLNIHNDMSENKDYKVFVFVDKEGNKYTTSSESFYKSYEDIQEEIADAGEDISSIQIKCLLKPSKNYKGKSFITCTLA